MAMKNNTVLTQWSTATEYNNHHFEVWRSYDGITFELAGKVKAAGNSSTQSNYSFIDHGPEQTNSQLIYYRLKQVDNDSAYKYSTIINVSLGSKEHAVFNVFPNPVEDKLNISYYAPGKSAVRIILYNTIGAEVYQKEILPDSSGISKLTINRVELKITGGNYLLKLVNNDGAIDSKWINVK